MNPRTKRQRQELYWFMLISVGAALRVGEAYSLPEPRPARAPPRRLETLEDQSRDAPEFDAAW